MTRRVAIGTPWDARTYDLTSAEFARMGLRRARGPRPGPLDGIFAVLCYLALCVALLAWAVVIAPLQYLGNLVAGAPVRLALASPLRTYVRKRGKTIELLARPADAEPPDGAELVGVACKPVATTASISAGLLYATNALATASL